jgi:hypothetical protein
MTTFITSIEKHNEIKQYVLDMIADIDFSKETRVVSLPLDHTKVQEWYCDAIEEFRQYQISRGEEHTIFDPQIIWINVYPTGTNMNSHTHPDYHFYSIHYLQKSINHSHTQLSDDGEIWTNPDAVEGDIIFFSGTTYHRVLENTLDTLRISIGMNASSIENTPLNLEELRKVRNQKLVDTDWWVMRDVETSEERLRYRQELRDITSKYTSLQNVVWPTLTNL